MPNLKRGSVRSVTQVDATIDFASIAANTNLASSAIAVPGARPNDIVQVGPPAALSTSVTVTGFVSANDQVKVIASNNSAGAIDPASGTFRVWVLRLV